MTALAPTVGVLSAGSSRSGRLGVITTAVLFRAQWFAIAALLVACVVGWFALFGLGSTLSSEQFRHLLNVASVDTVHDGDVTDKATPGAPLSASGTTAAGEVGLIRSWSDLRADLYRLRRTVDGKRALQSRPRRTRASQVLRFVTRILATGVAERAHVFADQSRGVELPCGCGGRRRAVPWVLDADR